MLIALPFLTKLQTPPPPVTELFSRTISLSERGKNGFKRFDSISFRKNQTKAEAEAMVKQIDDAYRECPVPFTMWRDWQVAALLKQDDELGAIRRARALLDIPGYIDLQWLKSDPELAPKLKLKEWDSLFVRSRELVERRSAELSPSAIGLDLNRGKIEILSDFGSFRPNPEEWLANWNRYVQPTRTGTWLRSTIRYTNPRSGAVSYYPYFLYIPKGYRADKPQAAMAYSFGGWIGSRIVRSWTGQEFLRDNPTIAPTNFLDQSNTIGIAPMFNKAVSPLSPDVGGEPFRMVMAEVKSFLNIDEDRCYLSGFSDGGTACYEVVRNDPSDFAAIFPLNGYPLFKLGYRNLANRPIRSYSGETDDLYPAASFGRFFSKAKSICPDWTATLVKEVGHYSMSYNDSVMPEVFQEMQRLRRNSFSPKLQLETGPGEKASIDWLALTEVDPTLPPAPWHDEIFVMGKRPPQTEITKIVCNDKHGMVRATFAQNTFSLETSRVKRVRLRLLRSMVDPTNHVKVELNGKVVYDQVPKVEPDWIVNDFLTHFDRKALALGQIEVEVK